MKLKTGKTTIAIILVFGTMIVAKQYGLNVQSASYLDKIKLVSTSEIPETRRYYYEQLTQEERKMYEQLASSKQEFMENQEFCLGRMECLYNEAEIKVNESIKRAIWAYRLDNPISTLWLNHYEGYFYVKESKEENVILEIIITPGENGYYDFETKEELQEAIEMVKRKTKEFVQQLFGTNEEKLYQIQEWLLDGTQYDFTAKEPNMNTVFGCIVQKVCVCGGLTYSFKYVADMAEIPVLSVIGEDKERGLTHVWNVMFVNDEWYRTDLTAILDGRQRKEFLKVNTDIGIYETKIFQVP